MKLVIIIAASVLLTSCTSRPVPLWTFETDHPIVAAAMLGSTKQLAVMTKDNVSILDVETGKEVSNIRGFGSDVREIACKSSMCWIGGGIHLDGRLYTVDTLHRKIKRIETSEEFAAINSIALSTKNILITGHDDETLISWDADTMQPKKRVVAQSGGEILAVHFIEDTIVAGNSAGELILWDGQSDLPVKRINLANGTILSITTIGNRLSVGGWEFLDIIDPTLPTAGQLITLNDATVISCDATEDNNAIWCGLTGGSSLRVNIKELNKSTMKLHNDDIQFVKALGDLLITASKDKTVKVWKQSHLVSGDISNDNPGKQ